MKLNFKGEINLQHLDGFYFPPLVFLSYTRESQGKCLLCFL